MAFTEFSEGLPKTQNCILTAFFALGNDKLSHLKQSLAKSVLPNDLGIKFALSEAFNNYILNVDTKDLKISETKRRKSGGKKKAAKKGKGKKGKKSGGRKRRPKKASKPTPAPAAP